MTFENSSGEKTSVSDDMRLLGLRKADGEGRCVMGGASVGRCKAREINQKYEEIERNKVNIENEL